MLKSLRQAAADVQPFILCAHPVDLVIERLRHVIPGRLVLVGKLSDVHQKPTLSRRSRRKWHPVRGFLITNQMIRAICGPPAFN